MDDKNSLPPLPPLPRKKKSNVLALNWDGKYRGLKKFSLPSPPCKNSLYVDQRRGEEGVNGDRSISDTNIFPKWRKSWSEIPPPPNKWAAT